MTQEIVMIELPATVVQNCGVFLQRVPTQGVQEAQALIETVNALAQAMQAANVPVETVEPEDAAE